MKRKNITILVAAILMATTAACEFENENESENGNRVRLIPVETINIQPDSFDDYIRVSGIVQAIEDATISSENSGRILSIRQRGELVREGEIIANMDDRLSRAQFEAAQTNFELANDTYDRLQSLYEEEIISTQDYQSARAQRDQARAQMNQAEKQLRDTHVEAPFTGRIEERFVNTGELINPGMPVVRLVNSDIVRITAGIPERYASQITEGTQAQINLRAGNDSSFESQVTFVGNVIDSATRTLPVEIEISNVDGAIKPEMVVDIHIKRETIENAIIVPRTAIVRDESGINLFVVRNDNGVKVAELVPVTTGFASGPIIEILEGLQGGDEVVITGISTLAAGDQLNIVNNSNSIDKIQELQRRDRTTVSF